MTRGIYNNNPLNIRYQKRNNWEGKVTKKGVPSATCCDGESGGTSRLPIKQSGIGPCDLVAERDKMDEQFEEFISMYYGFRAAIRLMENYIRDGHNTINAIVRRWAPPTENDTQGYLRNVTYWTQMGGNENIAIGSQQMKQLIWSMALVESGQEIKDYLPSYEKAWTNYFNTEIARRV